MPCGNAREEKLAGLLKVKLHEKRLVQHKKGIIPDLSCVAGIAFVTDEIDSLK
jgi:hypothetical protein